jgi:hypothetical protein
MSLMVDTWSFSLFRRVDSTRLSRRALSLFEFLRP